jgi:hypothetical protein
MRRSLGTTLVAALAAAVLPFAAAAGSIDTWSSITLRHAADVELQDADFQGADVAALWAEAGHQLWFRTSANAGGSFAGRQKIAGETRDGAADLCGSNLYLAYARKVAGTWGIRAATRRIDGAGLESSPVSVGEESARDPDVACAGRRLFVSWLERAAGHFRVRVANALRSDELFVDPPMLFGNTRPGFGAPVMAGVADRAYMAAQYSAGFVTGPVVFYRWSIGAAPQATVAFLGSTTLARDGMFPVIAARGTTVVVAWFDGSTGIARIGVRVSHDRGATWGAAHFLVTGTDTFTLPESIAFSGQRIVIPYALVGKFGGGDQRTLSSRTDFATFSDKHLGPLSDYLLLGFVSTSSGRTRAAVNDVGNRLLYLRQN